MRDERRQACRFAVLGEQQQAVLRVGDALWDVVLADHSATGFSLVAEQHPGVFPGEVVWLKIDSGWNEVRVVKVRQEQEGTRIGLERLTELPLAGPERVGRDHWFRGDQLGQPADAANPWIVPIACAAVVAVLAAIAWLVISGTQGTAQGSKGPPPATPIAAGEDTRPAAVREIERLAQGRDLQFRQGIQRLGAMVMTLPDVVRHLQLTDEQQQRIGAIVEATTQADRQLKLHLQSTDRRAYDSAAELLYEQARLEALALLTDDQQKAWNAMLDAAFEKLGAAPPADRP